jgi:hypothetical protein
VPHAAEQVAEGRTIVVDFEISKVFYRVNHDVLMAREARHVVDKRLFWIVLLEDLGKEFKRRGHRFICYADNCNIWVRTATGGRSRCWSGNSLLLTVKSLTFSR